MDERLKKELAWAAGSFLGSLAFLMVLGVTIRADTPSYALVTGAALMAIAIDGYRFYQENAQLDEDVRTTGMWRPSRLIPAKAHQRRVQHGPRSGQQTNQ